MNLLAIDPGAETCACAYFEGNRLAEAAYTLRPRWRVDVIIVERMQADSRTRNIDIRHLLACQFNGGFAAGVALGRNLGAKTIDLTPTEWKGSEPKPVQHARLFGEIDHDEQEILGGPETARIIERAVEKGALSRWSKPGADYYPRKWTVHNLLDAAALGCTHLGRIEKR